MLLRLESESANGPELLAAGEFDSLPARDCRAILGGSGSDALII